jgi:RHS repeat-associated protein
MAGYRPADWHVLDLDKDPTPGDPDRVRSLARQLHDFADDVADALRIVKGMAGDEVALEWAGKSAKVFQDQFSGVPKNLKKLKKSYELCGDALAAYWPKLERAQALADKALAKGREARDDLTSAQSRLASADSWMTRAGKEADKYKDDPTGSKDTEKPDEAKVRAATRDVQHAKSAHAKAQSDVSSAQDALDAAKKMAADARQMRDEAARETKSKIDEASDAGIQNRSWWEEVGDWFEDNWDTIVTVCKVVVAVLGIIAMIIGGPILGAIVLVAALVVLADTLYKYSKGQASLWDVGFAALDCIPGMKGLTTLGGLAKGLKGGLAAVKGMKGGLKGMALAVRGLGKSARGAVAEGAKGAYNRLKSKIKGCGDPVDVATGEMFLAETDVSLPGTLPLEFTRRAASGYRCGWWFGPSWASTLDQRLEIGEEEIIFVTEDGMLLVYRVADSVQTPWLPEAGPRMALVHEGDGTYRVDDPLTGLTRRFARRPDGTAPITGITDRNSNSVSFAYDPFGAPLGIRHSGGYHLAFTTDQGRVTAMSLVGAAEDGSDVVLRRYDYTDGHLTGVVNSSGLALAFGYDERLRITSWTDRNGCRYSYAYDDLDRCVSQGGEAGHVAGTFAYDGTDDEWPDCRVTTYTASGGGISRFVVNDKSQVVAEIDPLGHATRTHYDEHHHLLSRTDAVGNTTRYENNAFGRPTRVVLPDEGVVVIEYDTLQLPVRVVRPDGTVWEHEYDDRGNRVSSTAPDGSRTLFTYDDRGALASVTDPLGATTRVGCNPAGLRTETISALGDRTARTYDPFGRLDSATDPLGNTTRLQWTVEGRLALAVAPDGSQETWTYDGEGNCTSHIGPGAGRTSFEYGPFDLLLAQTGPDGGRYEFAYDASLNVTQVTNPLGLRWSYTYDAAGRLVAETDFDEQRTDYERDEAGRLAARVNPAGQRIAYTYDAMGRLLTKTSGDETTTYAYDAMGRLIHATGPDCDLRLARDLAGRTTGQWVNGRLLESAYDATGRRVRRTTPSGARATYTYDALGRMTCLDTSGHTVEFAHDAAGQEVGRLIDGSLRFTQAWDVNGRPREQLWTVADRQIRNRTYGYGADRHLARIADAVDGLVTMDVDVMGRVQALEDGGQAENYSYDRAGRITFASWPGHPGAEEAQGDRVYSGARLQRAGAVRYVHDAAGRVTERRRTRLSRKPDVWRYTWDAEDRLTSVVTPDGTVWRYLYDPLGRRVAKERQGDDGRTVVERTDFTWDGPTVAEQTTVTPELPHPVTLTWDHAGLRPVAQTERLTDSTTQEEVDRRFFAIVTDLVGTPTELVDPRGTVAWRARRTAWGATAWSRRSQTYTPLRFPGQYQDPETGLHYNYHRHYDPETARYTSSDPLGLAPAPDPYAYVTNPWRQVDPLGLMSCDEETVVLYHGSRNWSGDQFSLGSSHDLQRQYTPDAGVYLTDDFTRAATQYAGPEGVVVRTEVPKSFADSVLREHSGPAGKQPEHFVDTQEGVDILNAGSPRALPQRDAVIQHMMGQF